MEMTSRKSFEIVSANLCGPSLRQMRVNVKQRNEPIICEETSHLTASALDHFLKQHSTPSKTQSLFYPSTPPRCQKRRSLAHNAVVRGAYPNHFICMEDKTVEHLKELIEDNRSPRRSQEIKVVVVAVRTASIGICPYFILAARPRTKNAPSNFNGKVITTCVVYFVLQRKGENY